MTEGLHRLSDAQREQALRRWQVLAPHLEDGVPLTRAAEHARVPLRTARRWLHRYREAGLAGLANTPRPVTGRKTDPRLVRVIEELALRRPRASLAAITRRAAELATVQGLPPVSYTTVRDIVGGLGPAMLTLAHDGPVAFRDNFELVYRRRAERPNAMWQADHTELDIHVVNTNGRTIRPWLTVVLDDHSRAVPGYTVAVGAPSALNTSLALRQAIWTKADPAWPMCGLPDVLYTDHGSDFISEAELEGDVDVLGGGQTVVANHRRRSSGRRCCAPGSKSKTHCAKPSWTDNCAPATSHPRRNSPASSASADQPSARRSPPSRPRD
ncbi:MAG: transposase [Rhodococcus sp. (in: high G+C Gram-positive bacteria)]|nr:MAG: transposase [Rhodococcus sp. (in: high G+C Gram-positive bacteria)]